MAYLREKERSSSWHWELAWYSQLGLVEYKQFHRIRTSDKGTLTTIKTKHDPSVIMSKQKTKNLNFVRTPKYVRQLLTERNEETDQKTTVVGDLKTPTLGYGQIAHQKNQ